MTEKDYSNEEVQSGLSTHRQIYQNPKYRGKEKKGLDKGRNKGSYTQPHWTLHTYCGKCCCTV